MKRIIAFTWLLATAVSVQAQVTVIGRWRLGEADAGATAGGASAGSTVNSASASYALTRESSHTYSADTPSPSRLSLGASTLSIQFSGVGTYSGYYREMGGSSIPTYSQNVGIEAWIKPADTTAGARVVVTVGDQDSGYAILQSGSALEVRYGTTGAALATFTGVSTSEWTHVALVRGSSEATFYVNGVSAGTIATAVPGWAASFEYFGIGQQPRGPGGQNFVGNIDEVRYFTYSGAFDTSMLNHVAAVPEPAGLALALGLGAWAAAWSRGRLRRDRRPFGIPPPAQG
jgi:hypothetical protein